MPDWSKVVMCPACGAGNPCDSQLCVRCHVALGQIVAQAAKERSERLAQTPEIQRITVSIPRDLVDFMREVSDMIEWHDERIEHVADDSIQAPSIAPVIGGVINVASKYFSFCYTAREHPETHWNLALFDNEIEDIAKRNVTTLSLWKCARERCHHLFTNKSDGYCHCSPYGWGESKK